MFIFSQKLLQYLLLAALFLGCCYSTMAAPTGDKQIPQIIELLNQGKTAQAYQLAEQLADEYIGQPDFDFAWGMAARANGHQHKAVFAFERAVIASPNNLNARLFGDGNHNHRVALSYK